MRTRGLHWFLAGGIVFAGATLFFITQVQPEGRKDMQAATAGTKLQGNIPPIDTEEHPRVETATFALG